ncbi:unnamed protein product [Mycena citricolor]|uniref:Uncharacterized protein n=1 Tax=Mycena citricolor TaxID=2018698 RepID=A0AAD2JWL7_9AGAR|nr:unnamed protein product [Mycena citricolor]CAK5280937.1 unnamed protein product [Mycena citricolor]
MNSVPKQDCGALEKTNEPLSGRTSRRCVAAKVSPLSYGRPMKAVLVLMGAGERLAQTR